MDELAKHLARGLIARLDEIERESGMANWQLISDPELRNEALIVRENMLSLKRKLGQI